MLAGDVVSPDNVLRWRVSVLDSGLRHSVSIQPRVVCFKSNEDVTQLCQALSDFRRLIASLSDEYTVLLEAGTAACCHSALSASVALHSYLRLLRFVHFIRDRLRPSCPVSASGLIPGLSF